MTITRNDDKVWFNTEIKLQQIRDAIVSAHAANRSILVLSHFEDTITRITAMLREAAIAFERFSLFHSSQLCAGQPGQVLVGLVRAFEAPSELNPPSTAAKIEIVVAEHHPMHSKDQELMHRASKLHCETQVTFHSSLDDPLLKHFNGDRLQDLCKRLGMAETECISNHLVTNAIRSAQENIEECVPRDVPTHSAADWFRYNLPK